MKKQTRTVPAAGLPPADVKAAFLAARRWLVEAGVHDDEQAVLLEEVSADDAGRWRVAVSYPVPAPPGSVEARRAEMMGFGPDTTLRTFKEVLFDPSTSAITAFTSGQPSYEIIAA